jgi:hypothetical protein
MRFRSLLILLFAVPGLAWTQTTPDAGFCQSVAGTYDERIAACSRAITLGNLSPEHVAALVHSRGMTWYYNNTVRFIQKSYPAGSLWTKA